MSLTLLTGGARSGKSALAARMGSAWRGAVTVIATGEARDEEMAARIASHRAARPREWTTIEEPFDLEGALRSVADESLVIVDCVTLWVANAMERGMAGDTIAGHAFEAAKTASARAAPTIVVTNEVGSGLVPMNPYGRNYRDVLGRANAAFADVAGRAYLIVAGRALPLLGSQAVIGDVIR